MVRSCRLWDLAELPIVQTFASPLASKSTAVVTTITPTGTMVAGVFRMLEPKGRPDRDGSIVAWNTTTGRELYRREDPGATAVAVTPDGTLLATGHEDGRLRIWSSPDGELVGTLQSGRNTISGLAFGRDPLRRKGSKTRASGWLLATGDTGSVVTIWDLQIRVPRVYCRGSATSAEVRGVGVQSRRNDAGLLWSLSCSTLGCINWGIPASYWRPQLIPTFAFSPDGHQIAAGSVAAFGWPQNVQVWDLETGRGIRTLRGLTVPLTKTAFSADGRLLAAASKDWHVGIWDLAANRLIHVLEVTPGQFADNVALAFSADGGQIAFSGGHEASLWDVATGELIRTWALPEGLLDSMAFPEVGRLLLYREETFSGEGGPFTQYRPDKYPRVCRLRNLLGANPLKPVVEFANCNLHVFHAECSPDGKYYVIDGNGDGEGRVVRTARLYDGERGEFLGSLPMELPVNADESGMCFDPQGRLLNLWYRKEHGEHRSVLLEIPSRVALRHFDHQPECIGPQASAGRYMHHRLRTIPVASRSSKLAIRIPESRSFKAAVMRP